MPDISMCEGAGCPVKQQCYRFTAQPNAHQWYAQFIPNPDGRCEHFMDAAQWSKKRKSNGRRK